MTDRTFGSGAIHILFDWMVTIEVASDWLDVAFTLFGFPSVLSFPLHFHCHR